MLMVWTNGVFGKKTDTQVSSQVQILLPQLMDSSIAAIGVIGKMTDTKITKGL